MLPAGPAGAPRTSSATDARAAGQVWHLPGPQTVTTRALLDLVVAEVGHPVGVRPVPKLAVRAP